MPRPRQTWASEFPRAGGQAVLRPAQTRWELSLAGRPSGCAPQVCANASASGVWLLMSFTGS